MREPEEREPNAPSDDVANVMPPGTLEPLAPIVRPLMVTVKAEVLIDAPDVVMTKEVAVVAPHVAVSPTMGVTEEAKKPEG